ncbi:hypothetical protein [Arthrobacter gengyunqii]|uniref:hypothetical protein n=1 Tax=Arthrobacter gengyunqii TaxID=2886940 RepID=UPI00311AA64B
MRSDQAGVGLGLTIVGSIVQAHDGTLTIGGRPAGGLRVSALLSAGEVSGRLGDVVPSEAL